MKHVLSDNPFYRLAPFLQEYIYRHQWTELREIQVLACGVLFDTADHLLLAAGTASGKTEAAFLPILTDLDQRPPTSIAVLYIGPTKALINDQFYRLEGLLAEAEIPLWAWHGDIAAHRKKKMLQNPSGILQITPESLESLLINHRAQLGRLFADLRYVVIDEVHLFMAADRGRQILCQLARLERLIPTIRPRRIGLSATLGDYAQAEQWLVGGDERAKVQTVASPKSGRLRLTLEQYPAPKAHPQNPTPDPTYAPTLFTAAHERPKTLIFANSRGGVETCISLLREMAQRRWLARYLPRSPREHRHPPARGGRTRHALGTPARHHGRHGYARVGHRFGAVGAGHSTGCALFGGQLFAEARPSGAARHTARNVALFGGRCGRAPSRMVQKNPVGIAPRRGHYPALPRGKMD